MNKKSKYTVKKSTPSTNKPSKWLYLFISIGVLEAAVVALWLLAILWLSGQTGDAGMGWGLVLGLLLPTVFMGAALVAIINVIGLPIYMLRRKPRGKWLVLSVMALVISLVPLLIGGRNAYTLYVSIPADSQKHEQEWQQELLWKYGEVRKEIGNSREITKEYAVEMLQSCQIGALFYTSQTSEADGKWGELSSTGVVEIRDGRSQPELSIADRHVTDLVSIVEKSRCFTFLWHDGQYWQRNYDTNTWNPAQE